jgi:hypothetical protein
LSKYNPPDDLVDLKLIQVSPRVALVGAAGAAASVMLWLVNGTFPTYFAFLIGGAVLPAMFLYRSIGGLTELAGVRGHDALLILTSVIWEATLAIPRMWWGYQPRSFRSRPLSCGSSHRLRAC